MAKTKLLLILGLLSIPGFAKIAPAFSGELLGGGRVSLKETIKPQRALLLSFWASWCQPCMQELKDLTQAMNAQVPNLDLLTINVDTSETSADVKPTLKLYGFKFPVVLDPKHEIFGKYQESKNLPFSVLVSSKGEVIESFTGYHENLVQEIQGVLKNAKK